MVMPVGMCNGNEDLSPPFACVRDLWFGRRGNGTDRAGRLSYMYLMSDAPWQQHKLVRRQAHPLTCLRATVLLPASLLVVPPFTLCPSLYTLAAYAPCATARCRSSSFVNRPALHSA